MGRFRFYLNLKQQNSKVGHKASRQKTMVIRKQTSNLRALACARSTEDQNKNQKKKKTETKERVVLAVLLRERHLLSSASAIAQPTFLLRLWHFVLTSQALIVTEVPITTVNITCQQCDV